MKDLNKLFIVYCIDAEGPLHESFPATFDRIEQVFGLKMRATKDNLRKLQTLQIEVENKENIARFLDPHLLNDNDYMGQSRRNA